MNADGSGQRRLTRTPGYDEPLAWSPDGRRLAFRRVPDEAEVGVLRHERGRERRPEGELGAPGGRGGDARVPCSRSRSRSALRRARGSGGDKAGGGRASAHGREAGRQAGHADARHGRRPLGARSSPPQRRATLRRRDPDPTPCRRERAHRLRAYARSSDVRAGRRSWRASARASGTRMGVTSFQALVAPLPRRQLRARAARPREPARTRACSRASSRSASSGSRSCRGRCAGRSGSRGRCSARDDYRGATIGIRFGGSRESTFEALGATPKGYRIGSLGGLDGAELDAATILNNGYDERGTAADRERRPLGEARDDRHLAGRVRAACAGAAGSPAPRRPGGRRSGAGEARAGAAGGARRALRARLAEARNGVRRGRGRAAYGCASGCGGARTRPRDASPHRRDRAPEARGSRRQAQLRGRRRRRGRAPGPVDGARACGDDARARRRALERPGPGPELVRHVRRRGRAPAARRRALLAQPVCAGWDDRPALERVPRHALTDARDGRPEVAADATLVAAGGLSACVERSRRWRCSSRSRVAAVRAPTRPAARTDGMRSCYGSRARTTALHGAPEFAAAVERLSGGTLRIELVQAGHRRRGRLRARRRRGRSARARRSSGSSRVRVWDRLGVTSFRGAARAVPRRQPRAAAAGARGAARGPHARRRRARPASSGSRCCPGRCAGRSASRARSLGPGELRRARRFGIRPGGVAEATFARARGPSRTGYVGGLVLRPRRGGARPGDDRVQRLRPRAARR